MSSQQQENSSLGARAARNLANTTKTPPQMTMITPRWLLRLLPWVDVEAGTFRVNRVRMIGEAFERIGAHVEGEQAFLEPGALRAIPILREASDACINRLADAFQTRQVSAGEVIVRQGDEATRFFIMARGKVEVTRSSPHGGCVSLGVLRDGDHFGEMGLLFHQERKATVTALVPTLVLWLDRERFETLLSESPELRTRLEQAAAALSGPREVPPRVMSGHHCDGEPDIPTTFVDYQEHPREYTLSVVQTTLRAHTRVTDMFRSPMDQLKEQLRLVIEAMRERQEWEILNSPDFGLVHNVAPAMRLPTRSGAPTPDDMDELLSLVWKEPAFFLAHPKAIAAFGRECTSRGVPPPTVSLMGTPVLTWRGVPIIPTDKLPIDQSTGVPTTSILLLRVGAERQGVVGLHQPSIGDPKLPSLAIRMHGVDQKGVANYLLTLYFSAAILTEDAAGCLEHVEIGKYRDYR